MSEPIKPVMPASIAPDPAVALDPLADKTTTGLEKFISQAEAAINKAVESAKPYTDKALETVKPYTDAAAAKTEEIMNTIQAKTEAATTSTTETTKQVSESVSTGTTEAASETGENLGAAKGVLGNIGETLTQAVNQFTTQVEKTIHTTADEIEKRTASSEHPGLLTRLEQFGGKIVEGAEKIFEGGAGELPATHPVQTTTNEVPHAGPA